MACEGKDEKEKEKRKLIAVVRRIMRVEVARVKRSRT